MDNCCGFNHDHVKELRKGKRLSQEALARSIGARQDTISKIEKGVIKEPTLWTVCQLSKFFGVPIEGFMKKATSLRQDSFL